MAAFFVSAGNGAAGSASLSVPFPTVTIAGYLLVLEITNKYPNNGPTTPSGWTLRKQTAGGSGASGVDTGNVYKTVYTKIADSTEGGTNQAVTITSGNSAIGRIWQYGILTTSTWDLGVCGGAYAASNGVNWSVTGDADPGVVAGDLILAMSAVNTDAYTYSAEAITQTGVTFGAATERGDGGVTNGDDSAAVMSEHPVTLGLGTAAPVYTMTASGTAANNPAGATVLLRLREVPAASVPGPGSDNVGGRTPRAYVRHGSGKWPWQKRPKGLLRGH